MEIDHTAEIITSIASLVAAATSLIGVIISTLNRSKLQDVHKDLNGKIVEEIRENRESAKAEGVAEEKGRDEVRKAVAIVEKSKTQHLNP